MDILLVVSLVAFGDTALLYWFLPYVTPQSIQFGVRIPREKEEDPVISIARQRYQSRLIVGTLAVFLVSLLVPAVLSYFLLCLLSVVVEISCAHIVYFLTFRWLHGMKVQQGWFDGLDEESMVIYSDESPLRHTLIGVYFMFPSLVILAIPLYLGITGYAQLPLNIPSGFYQNGTAYQYYSRSFFSVFGPTLGQVAFTALLLVIGYALTLTRQEIDASRPLTTYEQQTRFKSFYRDVTYIFASLVGMTFFLASIRSWYYPVVMYSFLYMMLPLIAGFVFQFSLPYLVGQMGSRLPVYGEEIENSGANNTDDDSRWKGGIFYYNKQDPSLLVGKRFGIGWSLNFANPIAWIIFGLGVIAFIALFLVLFLQ